MLQTSVRTYRLVRFDNGRPMRSGIPFDYLDPDHPALRLLREGEGLDLLARDVTSEYDLIRRVMQHVKEQWDHTAHFPMQHANALEVLEDVRSGLRGNFCVYFTHVLVQALWSLGIPCRYVHVAEHHWHSHATSECWSNEHRKWIIVDSDFNLCFLTPDLVAPGMGPVRDVVPQNARDVQQAWRQGTMGAMLPSQGPWAAGMNYEIRLGDLFGGSFAFIGDYQRVLDHGPSEWDGQQCHWYLWSEPGEPAKDYHYHHWALTHGNGVGQQISELEEYYWPLNEVVVEAPMLETVGADVVLRFETFTPFFAGFDVQHDDGLWEAWPAERVEGHRAFGQYHWRLKPARNVLRIRSRNTAGRTGPPALLEVSALPYVPPASEAVWRSARYQSMGGIATHNARIYVPCDVVRVLADDAVMATIGEAAPWPSSIHAAPAEPWNETVTIARARHAPLGQLFAPQACAVLGDGTLIVADAEHYRMQVFAADGTPRAVWGSQGTDVDQFLHLRAVAVAPDGTVYVADSGFVGPVGPRTDHRSHIRRFTLDGRLLGKVADEGTAPGQVLSPAGLCCDMQGNLWVADSGNHRVQCFSVEGRLLACWGQRGNEWGEMRYPTDVAIAPDGTVFVADPQHRGIWKFSPDGTALAWLERGADGTAWLRPGRLAVDGQRLFVGDTTSGLLHIFVLS